MKKTEIFFPFEPKPKGRPRFFRGHACTPKTTAKYEKQIKEYYQENSSDYYDGAVQIKLVFNMPIPKSSSKKNKLKMENGEIKCTKHNGDIDNLAKSILDSLNGVAFEDDCLITRLSLTKKYATDNNVGTEMIISEDVD